MAVEVQAFVDVALALGVDEEAERIVVLLELVADREVAIGRRIDVPGDRMAARPVAVGPCPDVERHTQTSAHVEAGAAAFGELPILAEIARAHFGVRLEAATGKHDRAGSDLDRLAACAFGDDAGHAAALAHEAHRRRLVQDRDATPLDVGIERLEQLRPAAPDVQRKPAPELELAVDLVGLPPEPGLQLDALLRHPGRGLQTIADQNLT